MATITLKDGDFGDEATVTVGEAALYLPDRARPGLNELVPLTAIAEIEDLAADRSGQAEEGARPGLGGLFAAGSPLGLAAGVFGIAKVKDTEFSVRLKDGRRFVATTDVVTLANLRAACRTALVTADEDAAAEARADAVIAKYVGSGALPRDPLPMPETATPTPAEPEATPSAPAEAAGAPAADEGGDRPVFGRRGL